MSPAAQGHAAMLLFSALVAGSFSLGSLAANEIAPAAINAARFAIAALVIGVAAFALGKVERRAFRAPWRYGILGGLFAIYFVLMFEVSLIDVISICKSTDEALHAEMPHALIR